MNIQSPYSRNLRLPSAYIASESIPSYATQHKAPANIPHAGTFPAGAARACLPALPIGKGMFMPSKLIEHIVLCLVEGASIFSYLDGRSMALNISCKTGSRRILD